MSGYRGVLRVLSPGFASPLKEARGFALCTGGEAQAKPLK